MKETKSFFLDDWGGMGMGYVPIIGCCGFLRGWEHSLQVIIPKAYTHDFIEEDDVKLWLEMLGDINLKSKLAKNLKSSDDLKVKKTLLEYFSVSKNKGSAKSVANDMYKRIGDLEVCGNSVGHYRITDVRMSNARVSGYSNLLDTVVQDLLNGDVKEEILKNRGGLTVLIVINDHPEARHIRGRHRVQAEKLNVVGTKTSLIEFILDECISQISKSNCTDDYNTDYYLVDINKDDYLTRVMPRSINSGIRMLYLDKYKGLVSKALELKKSGYSSWDSIFLAHVVRSSESTYDNYNGFISGRDWYYQSEKALRSSMLVNNDSTNAGFTKNNGVSEINYSEVDTYLYNDDYAGLLIYLKEASYGNDPHIGGYVIYNGEESKYITNGSHYEVVGSRGDSYLIIDNFFNQRHIKKSKFTINE